MNIVNSYAKIQKVWTFISIFSVEEVNRNSQVKSKLILFTFQDSSKTS